MNIEIPVDCPCCGYKLELVKDQLFCRNTACSAQLNKKLEHLAKTLSIKGFGPKTIEKLGLSDLTELFYLDVDSVKDALGSEKTAVKLLDEIERAKGADLATVLASFSIPLVGNTASSKIAAVVSHIDEINLVTCQEAGLGEKVTANLLNWLDTEYLEMKEFLPFSFKSQSKVTSSTNGPTICITGKLSSFKTKAEATTKLTEAGFTVVESVTKTLKYLVDEQNNGSSKRKKAEEYGVIIVNNLTTFLKENT
jgi:DNA ligase (NAD+)